jgi:Predicted membrane protein
MLHEPISETGTDRSIPKKTRLGIFMFLFYMVVYAGFVFIGMMFPRAMGAEVIGGQNLAAVYGFGLILLAVLMGLIYNFLCTRYENRMNAGGAE